MTFILPFLAYATDAERAESQNHLQLALETQDRLKISQAGPRTSHQQFQTL